MENEDNQNSNVLEAALSYAARGWSVIPISSSGDKKRPLVTWAVARSEAASESEIREWWSRFPDAGVAIVLGKVSGLMVADIDRSVDMAALGCELKTGLVAMTGRGGRHFYFQYEDGANSKDFDNGNSIRAHGSYVVAPPSAHISGGYTWLSDGSPSEITLTELTIACKRD